MFSPCPISSSALQASRDLTNILFSIKAFLKLTLLSEQSTKFAPIRFAALKFASSKFALYASREAKFALSNIAFLASVLYISE